jgi:hypothetical protein
MCAKCHFKAHANPTDFSDFVQKFLGDKYEELKERARGTKIWANYELEELYKRFEEIRGAEG